MGWLTLIVAIAISGVAAWYSIVGLMAIFAAAAIPIAVMGGVLEVGKLLTASWLYQNWKTCPKLLKSYLTASVVVLMFITSMGIFGFLSKAHIDQTLVGGDNSLEIKAITLQIEQEERVIKDATQVTEQLDQAVETLIEYDRIRGPQGAIAVRESQRVERGTLAGIISEASGRIKSLRDEARPLQKQQLQLEAEVGPIKYIAALFYEDTNKSVLEEAVRWVIITIIFVFDPLAVLLIICANMSLTKPKKMRTAVNVADDWKDVEVETDEEETFSIKDIPPDATVEVTDLGKINLSDELEEEWHEDLYKDKELEDKFKSLKSKKDKRTEQNAEALQKNGTFGPTEKN
tara:strand:+ start:876 stop:1913 length:1038 start_codon:yes stop_codon:yes gene_type:complete